MPDWQRIWRDGLRDPAELLGLLGLESHAERLSEAGRAQFPFRVPRGFAAKMRWGDIDDPLLRQVVPLREEEIETPGFGLDAVGDLAARGGPGILHKYRGRALLVATGACAINCRYCFRRHFPYAEETAAAGQWQAAVDYLLRDNSIHAILLSGGDPLSLSTAKLKTLTDALAGVPHLRRLRIHTRLPIVLPERVDGELTDWLAALPWPTAVVVHVNHGNELCGDVASALARLRATGAALLNQSVLLAGVNDNADALCALSERLFECGVLPYYLHQLDKVRGTAHFLVEDGRALALHRELIRRLPGYLVPKLVREIAGEAHKTPMA